MWRSTPWAVLFILVFWSAAGAATPPGVGVVLTRDKQNPEAALDWRVHTVGDVFAKVGNSGMIGGRELGSAADPDSGSGYSGSFVFRENGREHLFNAGLWIGGLVDDDTLVASAVYVRSQTSTVYQPTGEIKTSYKPGLGWQSFVAECIVNPGFGSFAPVGIQVTQTSHEFASRPYDRFVLLEYTIRNVSERQLQNVHVGLFADPDIVYSEDDLTGYSRTDGIAYTIDNRGQHVPSAFGLSAVNLDPQPCCTTFNWWATDHRDLWWGPNQRTEDLHELQTPIGMYRVMANHEVDYDQWLARNDYTSDGWNLPPSDTVAQLVAAGLDTRWVMSYEFGDLGAGDSLRLVFALAIGDSVRVDKGAADPPELNLANLRRNIELARLVWNSDFSLHDASPTRFAATAITDSIVRCDWTAAPYAGVSGYKLFRKLRDSAEWNVVATVDSETRKVFDQDLSPGHTYEYSISSINQNGAVGSRSRSARVKIGFPRVAPLLTGRCTPAVVGLNWTVPETEPGFVPYSWINIERISQPSYWDEGIEIVEYQFPLTGTVSNPPVVPASAPRLPDRLRMNTFDFLDRDVNQAVTYSYSASFTNSLGFEGPWSPSINITPLRARFDGIVVLHTDGGRRMLVESDSMTEFYTQWAQELGFRVWGGGSTFPPLFTLALYRCAVIVMEDINAEFPVGLGEEELGKYLANRGRVVFIARNHAPVGAPLRPHPLLERFLGISRTHTESPWEPHRFYELPTQYVVAGFTGAQSQAPDYPEIEGDSAAAWSIKYWMESAQAVDSVYAAGFVPGIGCVDSLASGTEVLYTYRSAYDTSFFKGKPIAVRRITDSTAAILFNFPLSLMKHDQAWRALTQAVADLGIDTTHAAPIQESPARMIIDWLYGRRSGGARPEWDRNDDGVIDIRDVVHSVDQTWRGPSH